MFKYQDKIDDFFKKASRHKHSVTFLGAVTDKGELKISSADYCHAGLDGLASGHKLEYVLSSHQRPHNGISNDAHLSWVDYFINRSPWADVHMMKDPEWCFTNGYIMNPEMPQNLIGSACIISRFNTEGYGLNNFKTWGVLNKFGVDGDTAVLFSHVYSVHGDKITYGQYTTHNGFYPIQMDVEGCKAFLRRELDKKAAGKPYNEARSYRDVYAIWGATNKHNTPFERLCQSLRPKKVGKLTEYNIFKDLRTGERLAININKDDVLNVVEQFKAGLGG